MPICETLAPAPASYGDDLLLSPMPGSTVQFAGQQFSMSALRSSCTGKAYGAPQISFDLPSGLAGGAARSFTRRPISGSTPANRLAYRSAHSGRFNVAVLSGSQSGQVAYGPYQLVF